MKFRKRIAFTLVLCMTAVLGNDFAYATQTAVPFAATDLSEAAAYLTDIPIRAEKTGTAERPEAAQIVKAAETPEGKQEPEKGEGQGPADESGGDQNPDATEEPGGEKEPSPTDEPGGDKNPVPTDEPGENKDPVPTDEPGGGQNPNPTDEPGGDKDPSPTDGPGGESGPEPTPTLSPELPGVTPEPGEEVPLIPEEEVLSSDEALFAVSYAGEGTEENPYIIMDAEGFLNIGSDLSASYRLGADIDFDGVRIVPIGTSSTPFQGTLDGDSYTLSNVTISKQDTYFTYMGLFGYASSAVFQDIHIEHASVVDTLGACHGILTGSAVDCMMEHITFSDIKVSGRQYGGTLGGTINRGTVTGCSVTGQITIEGVTDAGGLAGVASSSVFTDCSVSGTGLIQGSGYVGGLIGRLAGDSRLYQCYAAMEVSGVNDTGGLIGEAAGTSALRCMIEECFSSGNVSEGNYIGGLIGSATYVDVINSFASGRVIAKANSLYMGGLFGYGKSMNITNSYAAGEVVGHRGRVLNYASNQLVLTGFYYDSAASGLILPGVGKLTPALLRGSTYEGWDFDAVWDIREGSTYPFLRVFGEPDWEEPDILALPKGAGTAEEPFLLETADHFKLIPFDPTGAYRLAADIDLDGEKRAPVGTVAVPFSGSLDGDGYTLSNIRITSQATYAGLFGYVEEAVFSDLILDRVEVLQSTGYDYAGGLAGFLNNCTAENITLSDVTVSGRSCIGGMAGHVTGGSISECRMEGNNSIAGTDSVGGLIGRVYGQTVISGCSVSGAGKISGNDYVGGLIGNLTTHSVHSCFSTIEVEGNNRIGGLIGYAVGSGTYAAVEECYATGKVTGQTYVGGLVGMTERVNIRDCFARGKMISPMDGTMSAGLIGYAYTNTNIQNCYTAGRVSGQAGGLIYTSSNITVNHSYFDTTMARHAAVDAYNVGRSSADMLKASTYEDWDFIDTWEIREGENYPYLRSLGEPAIGGPDYYGTKEDPILITDAAGFQAISDDLTASYQLASDIDFEGETVEAIGSQSMPFQGTLDGAGYTISNLTISGTGPDVGLFGRVSWAELRNINIQHAKVVTTSGQCGVLAGYAYRCVMENITLSDVLVQGGTYTGALCGDIAGGSVHACTVTGAISITGSAYTGGLAGMVSNAGTANKVVITDCLVSGTGMVKSQGYAGGLVGRMNAGNRVLHSYTSIAVSGSIYAGGLVGWITGEPASRGMVDECYAIGPVSGDSAAGGLIGLGTYADVNNSFALGSVTSIDTNQYVAGLLGRAPSVNITNSYAAGKVAGTNGSGLTYGLSSQTVTGSYYDMVMTGVAATVNTVQMGKMTPDMLRASTYAGWDFEAVWDIREGETYPYLRALGEPDGAAPDISILPEGSGTAEDPFLLKNVFQFGLIKFNPAASYRLTADMDLAGETLTPIGNASVPFTGRLDGDGHILSNIVLTAGANYAGLFGYAKEAEFADLSLEQVLLSTTYSYVGALAGYTMNCRTTDITLIDVTVTGGTQTGGMIGYAAGGVIETCKITGDSSVTGTTYVGGLVGSLWGDAIRRSFTDMEVKGNSYVGGLTGLTAGSQVRAAIEECYAMGNVNGQSSVGGLIGGLQVADVSNCFARGDVTSRTNHAYTGGLIGVVPSGTVKNSYAAGRVNGSGSSGLAYGGTDPFVNSYFDSVVSGITVPLTQARTTDELLIQATYVDWDWEEVWRIREGFYPVLKNVLDPALLEPVSLRYNSLTEHSVVILWPDLAQATGYELTYGDQTVGTDRAEMLVEDLTPDTEYTFRLKIWDSSETELWSLPLVLRTLKMPDKIYGLHSTEKEGGSVTLTWNPIYGAERYEVLYQGEVLTTGETTCVISGLLPERSYRIRVRALMEDGSQILSDPIVERLYTLAPQTEYARAFIGLCEGQTWFMDEIENYLSLRGKSINTIRSREEFATLHVIGLANRGLTGEIPPAIGELYQLRYLYLANNELGGEIPEELYALEGLTEADWSGNQFVVDER